MEQQRSGVEENPRVSGRTVGDVIYQILNRPLTLLTFIALVSSLAILVLVCIEASTRLLGMRPSEIQLGAGDSHVVLQMEQAKGGGEEYLIIVNPQGWQGSDIPIHKGDHATFTAGGRVCIDLHEISEKVELRQQYEAEWATKKNIRRDDDAEKRAPEDFFTDEEKKALILSRPWVDPEGFSLAKFQPSFRSRKNRYLLPGKPAGALVAAIIPDSEEPQRNDAFFVGRASTYVADKDGNLWFTVNDVQSTDPDNPNLFYNDNIGSFWVRVVIKHS